MYDGRRGPNAENVKIGPPDRWKFCPKIGKIVADRFVPFKTPLCSMYDDQLEKRLQFHPQDVFDAKHLQGMKIGLWIDLTKTSRFYFTEEVESHGCKYRKIAMKGHGESPSKEEVENFIKIVDNFLQHNTDSLIGVHCTHGFNRTGFCIVSYIVEKMDWDLAAAITAFRDARPCGIYKQDYITDLFQRYDAVEDAFEAPGRPTWEFNEESAAIGEGLDAQPSTSQQQPRNGNAMGDLAKSGKASKQFVDGKIPEVGVLEDLTLKHQLRSRIKELCRYKRDGFPGSQPVSMDLNNLSALEARRYKVSWKADGMRYLIYIADQGQIYAFDRDNEVFVLPRLTFPHRKERRHLRDTLVDCEVIFDHDPVNNIEIPRILIYDIITFEGVNLGKEIFNVRTDCIRREIFEARERAAQEGRLVKDHELCSVRHKVFWNLEATKKVLDSSFQKQVGHEVDGLIFQPVDEGYIPGRCDSVLKWKPPSHNSIDFKLQIRKEQGIGMLPQHVGYLYVQHLNEPFDKMKATRSLLPYDGKIIECKNENNQWTFMRERTDKSLPNSFNTAKAVLFSMKNPIDQERLVRFIDEHGLTEERCKQRQAEYDAKRAEMEKLRRSKALEEDGAPHAKQAKLEDHL